MMQTILKNINNLVLLVITAAYCTNAIGAEQHYSHGHSALDIFDVEGFKNTPFWVQVWVTFLLSSFAASFLFVWKHVLARWVIGGFIASMTSGHITFSLLELPFLAGSISIMHIVCWTPALILLLIKRPFLNNTEPMAFRVWSGIMTAVIIFSFLFDVKDAVIYINHVSNLT